MLMMQKQFLPKDNRYMELESLQRTETFLPFKNEPTKLPTTTILKNRLEQVQAPSFTQFMRPETTWRKVKTSPK